MLGRAIAVTATLASAHAQELPELLADLDFPNTRPPAISRFLRAETEAAPVLLAELHRLRTEAGNEPISDVRAGWVARALGLLGPHGAQSLPPLIDLLPDCAPKVFCQVHLAIGDLAPYATGDLRDELAGGVIRALRQGGGSLQEKRVTYLAGLELDQRLAVRLGPWTELSTADLVKALEGHAFFEPTVAAEILGQREAAAEAALPALLERANPQAVVHHPLPPSAHSALGPHRWERSQILAWSRRQAQRHAAVAVLAIAPEHPRALEMHSVLIRVGLHHQRLASIEALRAYGDDAREVIPALIDLLGAGERGDLAAEAMLTLGAVGRPAQVALPMLEEITEERDPHLAQRARLAIEQIRAR